MQRQEEGEPIISKEEAKFRQFHLMRNNNYSPNTAGSVGSSMNGKKDLDNSCHRGNNILFKGAPPNLVSYTFFYEKLVNVLLIILTKTPSWCWSILLIVFILIVFGIPLAFLLRSGNSTTIWHVLLPCFCVFIGMLLFCRLVLFKTKRWETLHDAHVNVPILNNFYEPVVVPNPQYVNQRNGNQNNVPGDDNNDTTTSSISNEKYYSKYKPRELQEIYYSNGAWRTTCHRNNVIKFRGINIPAKTPASINNTSETTNANQNQKINEYGYKYKRQKYASSSIPADKFYSSKQTISFINSPFPLNEAHEHFQRLSNYGFNLLRLTITWEAVVHENPNVYDLDYLSYISELIDIASLYGLYVIIDPHQDVWSRFTGGDGAPWWTLDAAGFNTDDSSLHDSGAAFLHFLYDGNDVPKMIWPTNYGKLAAATMFTLFFGGDTYAPGIYVSEDYAKTVIDNDGDGSNGGNNASDDTTNTKVTMQQFLQYHYLQFIDIVAKAVKDKPNVIGFNTMNEPSNGYIGVNDLTKRTFPMPLGAMHSYFDGMRVGRGESIRCKYYARPFIFRNIVTVNSSGCSAWKSTDHDIWYKLGLYSYVGGKGEDGNMILNLPHYFSMRKNVHNNKSGSSSSNKSGGVHGSSNNHIDDYGENDNDFMDQFMVPLFQKIQRLITKHNKRFIVYAEPFIDVNDHQHLSAPIKLDTNKYAWAPHWYDGLSLMFRHYIDWVAIDDEKEMPVVTKYFVGRTFRRILKHVRQSGNDKLHVVLGETGVPFDIDSKNCYEGSTMALDRVMRAIEENDLDVTLWNYFPNNTKEIGDDWCGEDLSIRMKDKNRALMSLLRPVVFEMSPDFQIVQQKFDPSNKAKKYELTLRQCKIESTSSHIIYIYLPCFHYSNPFIRTTFGSCRDYDRKSQLLVWEVMQVEDLSRDITLEVVNGAL